MEYSLDIQLASRQYDVEISMSSQQHSLDIQLANTLENQFIGIEGGFPDSDYENGINGGGP